VAVDWAVGTVKLLICPIVLLCAFGLLAITGSTQLQQLVGAHGGAPLHLLLPLLLAIPTSIITLVSAYLIEGALIGWRNSSLHTLRETSGSVRLDVLAVALELLPFRRLGYVLSLGLLYVLETRSTRPLSLFPAHWLPSWGVQVACVLLFGSFVSYWVHRLEHTIPALWALHKFHHSADRMSILTSHRQTDLARTVEQALSTLPLLLFAVTEPIAPKPQATSALFALVVIYFLYRAFIRVNQYLCHSNLTTDYGWIGRWLLVSPRMHRLHHAKVAEYHDKNFTFDLVIWDRIFGTYATCAEAEVRTVRLGLDDNPFNHVSTIKGVLRDYFLTSYIVFWQALRDGFRAWLPLRSARTRSVTTLDRDI
jgi:sterol desaturase/sphingolipid hydroxylase (fatty acid hydroxylase superfamily)